MIQRETILVVDDESGIRTLLKQSLQSSGYYCLEAGGASEALDIIQNNHIDLALLDINMPGKSGQELLDDLITGYPDSAVIMLTAITDNNVCIDCMQHGAYDYITKPFNPRELVVRVKQALEKRKLRIDNKEYQHHLEERVEEQSARIRSAFFDAITALAHALEAKDKYTSGHSQRVAETSTAIARQLGMPDERLEKIQTAALVHDLGKIGVNENILNKPGRLASEEYAHICQHCDTGERILKPITQDDEILSMVRHHHERYDGSGYPDGLKGNSGDKSLLWGIISLADAYDAMTSDRPYRKALPAEQALQEIKNSSGSQFNPTVVAAFLKIKECTENPIDK
jgi:putative two-component system response regulator